MSATTTRTARVITDWSNSGNNTYFAKSDPVPAGLVVSGQTPGSRPAKGYGVAGVGVAQSRPSGGYLVEGKLSTIRAKAKRA